MTKSWPYFYDSKTTANQQNPHYRKCSGNTVGFLTVKSYLIFVEPIVRSIFYFIVFSELIRKAYGSSCDARTCPLHGPM